MMSVSCTQTCFTFFEKVARMWENIISEWLNGLKYLHIQLCCLKTYKTDEQSS